MLLLFTYYPLYAIPVILCYPFNITQKNNKIDPAKPDPVGTCLLRNITIGIIETFEKQIVSLLIFHGNRQLFNPKGGRKI